ncbi:MAG: LL-diaminopimelate aminotransferase [Verrucomicrobia bacterium]|nr:LL-diaminopimelate aminotransferase [Verrucomicrobiota bacterium]
MAKINAHYSKLSGNYIFGEVADRAKVRKSTLPLISLGVGDITLPLPAACVSALIDAAKEMGDPLSYKGYGPPFGYDFLREAISQHDYNGKIAPDEIIISDGAKCDISNIQEIFCTQNRVALADPTYPVYIDTTVMAGRTRPRLKNGRYGGVTYLSCTEENGFRPRPPREHCDLVYLCSPNNPTGVAMDRELLAEWVAYAKKEGAILIYDGAYEAYIRSKDAPHSIYEIKGAEEVAIEIRSFSKSAGFTGLRLSYSVFPHALKVFDCGREHSLNALWKRRHETKYGGTPYAAQRAGAALYTPEGKKQLQAVVQTYSDNALLLRKGLQNLGLTVYGGIDAPYIWCKAPAHLTDWEFFDILLNKAAILSIPGSEFGSSGSGFLRMSAFAPRPSIEEALQRLRSAL